jgi:excisionase family DNA binding protein
MNAESPFMRVQDAADYCHVHPAQIFRACRERKLEHVRVGGRKTILVKREWVDTWLDSLRVHVKPGKDAASAAYGDAHS